MSRPPEQLCFPWYAAELQAQADRNVADREQARKDHETFRRAHRSERERFALLALN
jgi:hypothetical protein